MRLFSKPDLIYGIISLIYNSGFNHDDRWGHRAGEPNKAVICSLALAKLRTDIKGDLANNNTLGMAQKLLLFWRKPARRCWWEGVELEGVEGVQGKLKVWIRRVWTLEMVGYRFCHPTVVPMLTYFTERYWIAVARVWVFSSSFLHLFPWNSFVIIPLRQRFCAFSGFCLFQS